MSFWRWHVSLVWRWMLGGLGALIGGMFLLAVVGSPYLAEVPYRAAFGWIAFLKHNVPVISLNAGLIASFGMALGSALLVMHRLILWARPGWRWRSTFATVVLVLVLFGAAIAGAGVGHQIAWLGRGLIVFDSGRSPMVMTMIDARQLAVACNGYADNHESHYPAALADLVPVYIETAEDLSQITAARLSYEGESESLIYLGAGLKRSDPWTLPLVVSPRVFPNGQGYVVVPISGDASRVKPETLTRLLAEVRELKRSRAK